MARVIKFPVTPPEKLGPKKVKRKRRRPDPEDYGQMNLFDGPAKEGRLVSLPQSDSFFEEALMLDEQNDPSWS